MRSMDGNDTQVSDWIDRNLNNASQRVDQTDSENDVYNMRSSDDDLKLGAEAIVSDRDSVSSGRQEMFRMNSLYNRNHLPSQDSESSWTSNLSCSSPHSKLQALSSYSHVGSIASVEGVQCALDSLPLTATDILYNLGFASSDTYTQVPPRFLGPTNANLGDWNGRVYWSDQVGPVSNFEYLFNMMDDTPAMEDEIVDVSDNSGDWGSFRSALGSSCSSTTSGSNKPIFSRSHSLPEEAYQAPTTKEDKPFIKIKLKRHRSQLCLQQSFDTITEEEEAIDAKVTTVSAQPNLETIEGSFTTSVDSVVNPYNAPAIRHLSHYDPLVEDITIEDQTDLEQRLKNVIDEEEGKGEPEDQSVVKSCASKRGEKRSSFGSNPAKLKRQSCEEIVNVENDYDMKSGTEDTWQKLKRLLEETERKAFNTWLYRYKARKKKLSHLRSVMSLPDYLTGHYPPTIYRKSLSVCDETETETSESDHSLILLKKPASEEMLVEIDVKEQCLWTSVPVIIQSSYDDSLDIPNSPLMIDRDTDSDTTVRAISPVPSYICDSAGRTVSPLPSFTSDAAITFEQTQEANPEMCKDVDQKRASDAKKKLDDDHSIIRSKLCKLTSTNPFYLLNDNFKSPFYICTPRLRHKERSSSLPLLSHPELVRSKLRRAETESPNNLRNIIEEYDADLDDDDLLFEQEEWQGRIYRNILKSMTSSAEQNEILLKRIEEQVEGDGDDLPIIHQSTSRRRRSSSFSRSADEATVSSTDEEERQSNMLEVKPRRKRKSSTERKKSRDAAAEVSSHSETLSPQNSLLEDKEKKKDNDKKEKYLKGETSTSSGILDIVVESKPGGSGAGGSVSGMGGSVIGPEGSVSEVLGSVSGPGGSVSQVIGSVSDPEETVSEMIGSVSGTVESVSEMVGSVSGLGGSISGVGGSVSDESCAVPVLDVTEPEAERVSDIFLQDTHRNSTLDEDKKDEERGEEWEIKVLQDVLHHFKQDCAAQERAIEERKRIDRQMRMEIKMLETEIAAQKLEMEFIISQKSQGNNCSNLNQTKGATISLKSPLAHTISLKSPLAHSTPRRPDSVSTSSNISLSPIQQMLLNRPTGSFIRSAVRSSVLK